MMLISKKILLTFLLLITDGEIHAFTTPATKLSTFVNGKSTMMAVNQNMFLDNSKSFLSSFQQYPSFIIGQNDGIIDNVDEAAAKTQAFTDSVNYFDGTIQILLFSAIVGISILAIVSILTDKMDSAIENVIVDFESTMKRFYSQQWREIEKELEETTSTEEERAQKLFDIMEKIEADKPELMAKIKEKMMKKLEMDDPGMMAKTKEKMERKKEKKRS